MAFVHPCNSDDPFNCNHVWRIFFPSAFCSLRFSAIAVQFGNLFSNRIEFLSFKSPFLAKERSCESDIFVFISGIFIEALATTCDPFSQNDSPHRFMFQVFFIHGDTFCASFIIGWPNLSYFCVSSRETLTLHESHHIFWIFTDVSIFPAVIPTVAPRIKFSFGSSFFTSSGLLEWRTEGCSCGVYSTIALVEAFIPFVHFFFVSAKNPTVQPPLSFSLKRLHDVMFGGIRFHSCSLCIFASCGRRFHSISLRKSVSIFFVSWVFVSCNFDTSGIFFTEENSREKYSFIFFSIVAYLGVNCKKYCHLLDATTLILDFSQISI